MSTSVSPVLGADEKYQIGASYGSIISTGLLAIIVCGTKLWVRKFMTKSWGLDDWATLGGLICVTIFNGIGLGVTYHGVGKHIQNVSPDDLSMWFLLYYICICIYLFVSLAVKASILMFMRRVFPTPYIQHSTLGLTIFLVLFTVSGTFLNAFLCNPPWYAYKLEYLMSPARVNYCFSSDTLYAIFMYQATVLFACDIVIFLLPFPALYKLQMNSAKKTALLLVFGSGAVACVAPAIRFQSIQFYKSGSTDTTFVGAQSLIWMAIEYNLGMVAGSLAGLRPLISSTIASLRSTKGNSAYGLPSNNKQFAGSYRLENSDNSKPWSGRSSSKKDRMQGDSVLEATVVGDRASDESDRRHILKTQSISITEEARAGSFAMESAQMPWEDAKTKGMV